MAGLLPRSKTHRNLKARQPQPSPGIEDIAGWDSQAADLARGLGIIIGSARDQQPHAQDAAIQSALAPGSHVVVRKPPAIKRAAYANLPPLIMPGSRTFLHAFTAPAMLSTRPILSPAAALPLPEDHVPTAVDFSLANSPDVAQRQAVAHAVRKTLSEYGFLYAVNHGIGGRAQTQARDAARQFFAQPLEDKIQLQAGKKASSRGGGYGAAMHVHDDDEEERRLIKEEGFTMMNTAMAAAPAVETPSISSSGSTNSSDDEDNSQKAPPTTTDEHTLRRALNEYRTAADAFSRTVLRLVATGLGLPEDHFALEAPPALSLWPTSGLRVSRHCHCGSSSPAGDPSGFSTDVRAQCGWLAVADPLDNSKRRRTAPVGLEVVDANMHWTEPPAPQRGSGPAVLVLVGDLLERATNGLLPCTPHRVRFGGGQGEQAGYGLTYFVGPGHDVCVEPALTCISKDGRPRFEPVRAGDWLDRRLRTAASQDGQGADF